MIFEGDGDVKLQVFTAAFRKIIDRPLGTMPVGVHQVKLELKDQWGAKLANGLYYVVVQKGTKRSIAKLLIVR